MVERVIIDTDPGVDDALALMLAFRSPELLVEAITTVGGNVSVEQTTRNAMRVLGLLDPQPRPHLGKGLSAQLKGGPVRAEHVHGRDGMGELDRFLDARGASRYPEIDLPAALPTADETLREAIEQRPGEISLITLGPLTNLARALGADRKTVLRLKQVVVMGGAVQVPGNVTPAAEFNMRADPGAAWAVLNSGLPITLVPLDVTRRVTMTRDRLASLCEAREDPVSRFILDATAQAFGFMERLGGAPVMVLHDQLAVGVTLDPSLVKTVPLSVDVETEGRLTVGMTVADLRPILEEHKRAPNVQVCVDVDAPRFLSLLEGRLWPGSS